MAKKNKSSPVVRRALKTAVQVGAEDSRHNTEEYQTWQAGHADSRKDFCDFTAVSDAGVYLGTMRHPYDGGHEALRPDYTLIGGYATIDEAFSTILAEARA
jgi:hypothetical protein